MRTKTANTEKKERLRTVVGRALRTLKKFQDLRKEPIAEQRNDVERRLIAASEKVHTAEVLAERFLYGSDKPPRKSKNIRYRELSEPEKESAEDKLKTLTALERFSYLQSEIGIAVMPLSTSSKGASLYNNLPADKEILSTRLTLLLQAIACHKEKELEMLYWGNNLAEQTIRNVAVETENIVQKEPSYPRGFIARMCGCMLAAGAASAISLSLILPTVTAAVLVGVGAAVFGGALGLAFGRRRPYLNTRRLKLKNLEKRDFEQEYEEHLAELKRLEYDRQPVQICEEGLDLLLQQLKWMFTPGDVAEVEERGSDKIAARIDMRMMFKLRPLVGILSDVRVEEKPCQALDMMLDKNVGRLKEVGRLLAK